MVNLHLAASQNGACITCILITTSPLMKEERNKKSNVFVFLLITLKGKFIALNPL